MISVDDLGLLFKLQNRTFDDKGNLYFINIVPIAKEMGLDIEEVMQEVERVCATRTCKAGGHVWCTEHNVLPKYRKNRELFLNRDHVEGLYQILAVGLGLREDY